MRRSDRRALMFIMVAALGVWGGVLLERWLAGRNRLASISEISSRSPDPSPEGKGGEVSSAAVQSPLPVKGGVWGEAFFDPNTADSATLVRAGLEPWQARNILKYRARGGRYRRVEDLKRVYGMTPEQYEGMAAYVKIDKRFQPFSEAEREAYRRQWEAERAQRAEQRAERERLYEERRQERQAREQARKDSLAQRYPRQEKFERLVQLDLNAVDTATLKEVPGIASYRARQIVRYRERLGGFVSTAQLAEIEGFPADELEAWFKVEPSAVRRIDINKASVQEMGRHPYIGFARARAIEAYRRNQGRITSLDDLQLLDGFSADERRRMEGYILMKNEK